MAIFYQTAGKCDSSPPRLTIQAMTFRPATPADARLLAAMNQRLIADEGHRNRMDFEQLAGRMADWLTADYRAVVFEQANAPVGYALYRPEPEFVYLRQFYVGAEHRRRGIGRQAIAWLRQNAWKEFSR